MIVFLDFDGVLHPEVLQSSNKLLERLPFVEEVLREYPEVEIVISSAWRQRYDDSELAVSQLRKHFSADISLRVVGVTPDQRKLSKKDSPESLTRYSRHWECESWIRTYRSPGTRWMAIDDRDYLFRPFTEHLMALHRMEAFTQGHQDLLRSYLTALTCETPWPKYSNRPDLKVLEQRF